jgi:ribose transport system substrate-binding protein
MNNLRLFLMAALIAAVGCSQQPGTSSGGGAAPGSSSSPVKVAFVTNNASDFWKIAEAGTKKAAEELQCEVLFRIPPTGTAQEQQQILEDLIATGVGGVAISPNDPGNWTEILNEFAAQVPIVTQDSDAPDSNRACYIGTNNFAAGQQAGNLIKKSLPDGGKIMLFVGDMSAQNASDRKAGIADVLKGTNIEIVDTRTDEADRAKAVQNVEDSLVTHPDLAALVGLWSYNGPAILQAVEGANKVGQIKIITFDEEDDTLRGVKEGAIEGTIVQQPYEFGYQSVRLLTELAAENASRVPEGKQIFVPVKTITKQNVDEYWAELKRMTGKA